MHENNLPRGLWKLGLVKELIVGNDGYTRGAAVTTQSKRGKAKVLRRTVQHLYPVEQCNPPVEQADPGPEVNVPTEPAGVEVDSAPDVRGSRNCRDIRKRTVDQFAVLSQFSFSPLFMFMRLLVMFLSEISLPQCHWATGGVS